MTTAAANEIKSNLGPDFSLLDAFDDEYLETAYEPVDADVMTTEQRQALNLNMADWFGIG